MFYQKTIQMSMYKIFLILSLLLAVPTVFVGAVSSSRSLDQMKESGPGSLNGYYNQAS